VSNEVVSTVPVGEGPAGVAVAPDSTRAYVANLRGDSVSVIDTAAAIASPATAVSAVVPVPARPLELAVSVSGGKVYVTHSVTPGLVSVIDTGSLAVVDTIAVGNDPSGIAIGEVLTRP
jgi:YVTN family beta-propeller protein